MLMLRVRVRMLTRGDLRWEMQDAIGVCGFGAKLRCWTTIDEITGLING